MSAISSIEWTDRTWNPTRGCSRVSEGCRHCYAERVAMRFSKPGQPYAGLVKSSSDGPRWTGKVSLIESALHEPLSWRKPQRVFVNSMSDLFHEALSAEAIDRVFAVMAMAPRHTFQVLTKRPERMRAYIDGDGVVGGISGRSWRIREAGHSMGVPIGDEVNFALPLRNVWLGTSVENQQTADERIPLLLRTPAAVRFISAEPLLAPIRFASVPGFNKCGSAGQDLLRNFWVIVGGESGPGARPCALEWIESLIGQCGTAGVPCFVKQLGAFVVSEQRAAVDEAEMKGLLGDDSTWPNDRWLWRAGLTDRKGADTEQWPEYLTIRQFPDGAA